MSDASEYDRYKADTNSLFDFDGNKVEVEHSPGVIRLYAWTIIEDSVGRPYERNADTLNLTPRQAIEVARRLFIAATE
jgi:hypothetical protein